MIIGLINKLIDLNNNRYAPSLPSSDLKFIGKPIIVNSLPWSESHGFDHKTKNMGAVEFYISLARQYNKPEILVLGSGVGFIPKIFLDNTDGRVLLVDAVNPDVGAGSVFDYGQYFDRNYSHLTSYKPRFFFLPTLTQFAFTLFSKSRNTFDIIFIDADHSEIGFTADLEASIKFLNPDGMIICHDTKLKHIADKIKSTSLNYTFFDIGAGFAILKPFEYASVEGEKWSDSILEKEINERQNESGARWDYLSDNGFVERIEKYYSIFTELVNLRDLPKIIEIGGNPNPAIRFFDNPGAEILVSVEPYVSNIAKPYFENIKSSHVLVENITQIKSNFDLIIILGADLSLTKNYKTFIKEVTLMYELITNSKYVMIETPNYSPSKLLEEILTQELSLIHQSDFRVNSTTNFSINNDYLDRNFKIYKNGKDSKLLRKKINDEQVETYAKFFQFDGYKFRANQPPPVQGNSLDLNLNFNTWPVEKSGTENFVWLRPHQEILFPKGKKRLEVELLVPPHEVLLESRFKYVLDIQSLKIVIRRRFFSRKVSIKLPFFVPSDKYGTEDKRELSFAVKSYNFS